MVMNMDDAELYGTNALTSDSAGTLYLIILEPAMFTAERHDDDLPKERYTGQ